MVGNRKIVLFILLLFVLCAVNIYVFHLRLPTNHLDGAFQTASSLYRIKDGQVPGQDFFPYLGIGPILLVYPLFCMFGADLHASQVAAQLSTILVGAGMVFVVGYLVSSRSIRFALASICIYLFLALIDLSVNLNVSSLNFTLWPGNSLRPIRSGLIGLVGSILIFYSRFIVARPDYVKVLCGSLLFLLILLWSNDYAYAVLLTVSLPCIYYIKKRTDLKFFLVVLATIVFLALFGLLLITAGGYFDYLRYNFSSVRVDQWWYFPPYSPTHRVLYLNDVFEIFEVKDLPSIVFLSCILIFSIAKKNINYFLLALMGLGYTFGGVVASIGGHYGEYFSPLRSWFEVTAFLIIVFFLIKRFPMASDNRCIFLFIIGIIATISIGLTSAYAKFKNIKDDSSLYYDVTLSGYLDKVWLKVFNDNRFNDVKIKEEYWGLLSAKKGILATGKVDSIIHALGSERNKFLEDARNADFVTTTNPSFSYDWQTWSFSQNFNFYLDLLQSRDLISRTPTLLIWSKPHKPKKFGNPVECKLSKNLILIDGDNQTERRGYLTFHSSAAQNNRAIRLIQNNLSIGGDDTMGYVSINPSGGATSFPVKVNHKLRVKLYNEDAIRIDQCRFYEVTDNKILFHELDAGSYRACDLALGSNSRLDRDCSVYGSAGEQQQVLVYGPYIPLPEGEYEATLKFTSNMLSKSPIGIFDIFGHSNDKRLTLSNLEIPTCEQEECNLKLRFKTTGNGIVKVEFRVFVYPFKEIKIYKVDFAKV